jgi:predicted dehydrogenase
MLMKPLRFGLIGVGKHGLRYAKHLTEDIPEAELVGICRRNRDEGEKIAQTYGCAYYADYRQLLADKRLDAVVVAVPPALHARVVEAACRENTSLLIEKPFAISVTTAQRIRHLITTSGVRCMVAHTLRFNSVIQTLKAHLPEIAPLHSLFLSQRFEPSPLAWLDRKAESGGGIILHTGVHSFDLLRFFSGSEVEEVWCQTAQVCTKETEDNFSMMCRLQDPILRGVIIGSRSTQSRSGLIELSGANGQLVGDHTHGFAYRIQGNTRIPLPVEPPIPTVRETLRAFVEGLRTGAPFPITVEDGVRAVAIAEACYRSASNGQSAEVQQ